MLSPQQAIRISWQQQSIDPVSLLSTELIINGLKRALYGFKM